MEKYFSYGKVAQIYIILGAHIKSSQRSVSSKSTGVYKVLVYVHLQFSHQSSTVKVTQQSVILVSTLNYYKLALIIIIIFNKDDSV